MGRFAPKGHTRGEWGFTVGFVVAGWGGLKRRREREQGKVLAERAARAKRNIYPGTQNMKVWDARGKMATRSIPLVSQFLLLEVTSSSIPSVSSVLSSSFLWTAAHLWTLPVFSTFSPQLSPPGRPFWQFFTPREQLATCSSHIWFTSHHFDTCSAPRPPSQWAGATNRAARATSSLAQLHQGCNPELLGGEVVVEVELAGHEHDPLHRLVHLRVSATTSVVAREEAAAKQADLQKLLSRWIPRPLKMCARDYSANWQLILLRDSDCFYCVPALPPSPGHMAPESWAAKCFVTCPARLEQLKKAKIPPETKR